MEVTHRYAGQSSSEPGRLGFAPDLNRAPTWFVGELGNTIAFREAISALHHVVTSDLRPQEKDRTAYFNWLEGEKERLLAEATDMRGRAQERRAQLSRELQKMRREEHEALGPYRQAEQRYFHWLYRRDREAWIILDPVIAIHPDEISFECFSRDEASYGRLSVDLEMFDSISESEIGVTNIDYSQKLYDGFQKIRSSQTTQLRIDPDGFSASTSAGMEVYEQKIDLPESWVRGFLQVSAAMTMPLKRVRLDPIDVHNLCATLRKRREKHGPRSIRVKLAPGAPVEFVFEPWGEVLRCPRSVCEVAESEEIRIWGRRRLRLLERLVPIARGFDLYLLGSGMPCFVIADLGPMRFTLGLSGWTSQDWAASAGRFDLLAPRRRVPASLSRKVLDHLQTSWIGSSNEIGLAVGVGPEEAASALTALSQAGRVMFDLDKGFWRLRDMLRDPLRLDELRFASEAEKIADECVAANLVTVAQSGPDALSGEVIEDGRTYQVSLRTDHDERIVDASCDCWHFASNKLRKGPCAHILALRAAAERNKYSGVVARFFSQGSPL